MLFFFFVLNFRCREHIRETALRWQPDGHWKDAAIWSWAPGHESAPPPSVWSQRHQQESNTGTYGSIVVGVRLLTCWCSALNKRFCSAQDGICALRKAHMPFILRHRSDLNMAFETVQTFVWFTVAHSHPRDPVVLTYIQGGWGGKGAPLQTPHYHHQRGFMPNTTLPPPDSVYAQHCAIASEGEWWWWSRGLSCHPSRFSPQCSVSWVWAKPRCQIPMSAAAPWCWCERVLLDTPVFLSLHCRCTCGDPPPLHHERDHNIVPTGCWAWPGVRAVTGLVWLCGACTDWPGVVVWCMHWLAWWGRVGHALTGLMWCMHWLAWRGACSDWAECGVCNDWLDLAECGACSDWPSVTWFGMCTDWPSVAKCDVCSDWPSVVEYGACQDRPSVAECGAGNDWPGVAECGACNDWPGVVVCVMTGPVWWCVQWLAQCGGVCNDWPSVVVCAMTSPVWWCV